MVMHPAQLLPCAPKRGLWTLACAGLTIPTIRYQHAHIALHTTHNAQCKYSSTTTALHCYIAAIPCLTTATHRHCAATHCHPRAMCYHDAAMLYFPRALPCKSIALAHRSNGLGMRSCSAFQKRFPGPYCDTICPKHGACLPTCVRVCLCLCPSLCLSVRGASLSLAPSLCVCVCVRACVRAWL